MLTADFHGPGGLIIVLETNARLIPENGAVGEEDRVLVIHRVKAATLEPFGVTDIEQMVIPRAPVDGHRRYQLVGIPLFVELVGVAVKESAHQGV